MISTGKARLKCRPVGTLLQSGQHQAKGSVGKRSAFHPEGIGRSAAGQGDQDAKTNSFMVGDCESLMRDL